MKQTAQSESEQQRRSAAITHVPVAGGQSAFIDNRTSAIAQGEFFDMIARSPRSAAQRKQVQVIEGDTAQRKAADEEELAKAGTAQRAVKPEEEHPLQGKFESVQKANNTGLPDNLKSGVESMSGLSMDDVKVHYNSPMPAQLHAHAYAQGSDIHVAPGKEQHLPHEAWHVVQQKQGRVSATVQAKGIPINDDSSLEHEADIMGARATSTNLSANRLSAVSLQLRVGAVHQRNAFLTGLANAANQIDYGVISVAAGGTNQHKLYTAIVDVVEKNRKRQAVLLALQDENLANEVVAHVNANWGGHLGALTAFGLDIRSSHSGGGIDPLLPQAAYEAAPVAGVSVAVPAHANLVESANWSHLAATTTEHTTDPDHPKFRGAAGQPPLLGGAARLAASIGRVASYFEFHAESVHDNKGAKILDGTRVVYDPFNRQYFLSEHYAAQYELINVPHYNARAEYAALRAKLQAFVATPAFVAATQPVKDAALQKAIGKILKKIEEGEY